MFEKCPFNYMLTERKVLFILIKTKNKLKHLLHSFNSVQWLFMFFYNIKHRHDNFGKLIWTIYLCFIWTSIIVTLYLLLCRSVKILEIMSSVDKFYNNLMVRISQILKSIQNLQIF